MSQISVKGYPLTDEETSMINSLDFLSASPTGSFIQKRPDGSFVNTPAPSMGGGSLALEIPTGAVDGNNKVYTTQSNPVFIEVSGQVMVSNVQDPSNYGFTITGSGPYTITFLTAPGTTQTPHSFHN